MRTIVIICLLLPGCSGYDLSVFEPVAATSPVAEQVPEPAIKRQKLESVNGKAEE